MRDLEIGDKCYKFFYAKPSNESGSKSATYEANKTYHDKKLFFFRRDEAIASIKRLMYFMEYGDCLAEIEVDQDLISNSLGASPEHYAAECIKVKAVYTAESEELYDLVWECLTNSTDFSKQKFIDVLTHLTRMGAWSSAFKIIENFKRDGVELTNTEVMDIKKGK